MMAGGASLAPSRWSLAAEAMEARRGYLAELLDGLRFLAREPVVRTLLVLSAAGTLLIALRLREGSLGRPRRDRDGPEAGLALPKIAS
jgi:hypothetical protein